MKTPKLTPDQKAQVLGDTPPKGRTPLCWLVVNPGGKLLAILDSESEAYWFTRNRGHTHGAVYFKAPCDYAAAPDLLGACELALANLTPAYSTEHLVIKRLTAAIALSETPATTTPSSVPK